MASYNGGADVSVLSITEKSACQLHENLTNMFGAYFFRITIGITFCTGGLFRFGISGVSIGLLNRFRKLHRKFEYILLGVAALIVLPIMCNAYHADHKRGGLAFADGRRIESVRAGMSAAA